ncbi:putative V-type proton ATPase subunit A [Piedraia hortae CBS 480.64]|uniref:V-type proton ATPase subunit a n=1 Tax=Piedraia hortae CBS 480.64 TaxID=1314780 RepID=A0A6A7BYJ1_9PEZI|nr:putative V-type proton ATPase subunit A [Piedraia hortae CBS 480.64]
MRPMWEFVDNTAAPSASEIDELADRSQSLEQRVRSLNESYETLKKREMELAEWRWVLREAGGFFDRARGQTDEIRQSIDSSDDAPLLRDMEGAHTGNDAGQQSFSVMNIGFVAGAIPRERMAVFERILWRTLRGNLYMNQAEIPDPVIDPEKNEEVHKNVFVIFAHGKEIIAKIRKISESLGASIYNVDENSDLRRDQIQEVNSRLQDLSSVLSNTKRTLDAELTQIGRSLAAWMIVIKKAKSVYQTLNRFSYDPARKTLVAEAWCPTNSLGLIKSTLQDVNDRAGLSVPTIVNQIKTSRTPPTYNKTNKFTLGFQTIIDAYGTAKYQEVNPGLYTIVTFPFLFAVMFGDFGHGCIMAMAALAMIYWEKPLQRGKQDELFGMAFYGRYIMLMMGIFSMYTGLIYCDAFSKELSLFPSMWEWKFPQGYEPGKGMTVRAERVSGYTYPFGLDWRWHDTDNDLLFSNSYKMKLSIILGWAHMTYSLIWSYVNAKHFRSPIDIFGNFIPGMIFFQSIFGYLVFTIVYKWCIDWTAPGAGQPPSLLNMLIYMFLQPGTVEEPLYSGQGFIQVVLVLAAIVQVPVLLFLKPFYLRWEHNRARAKGYRGIGETTTISALDEGDEEAAENGRPSFADSEMDGGAMITQDIDAGEHEEFEFSEVMIHQVIHTIEFCLNCVSHTASYLRLWALSLAHQQLSIVLWSMTLKNCFAFTGVLGIFAAFAGFGLWFILTVAVLVVMEGTSAMLHSLRLHWVEAMSKHFIGDGVPFEPFSFEVLMGEEMNEFMG